MYVRIRDCYELPVFDGYSQDRIKCESDNEGLGMYLFFPWYNTRDFHTLGSQIYDRY